MAPYFRGLRAFLDALDGKLSVSHFPDIAFYNDLATALSLRCPDVPRLHFFEAPHIPSRRKKSELGIKRYEEEVIETGRIPMRENVWHDFFNNFSWLLYPRFKMALMNISYNAYLQRRMESQQRSSTEDFTTMCDEASVLKVSSGDSMQPFIFGHALFESLLFGRMEITAMTLSLKLAEPLASDLFTTYQQVDRAAALWMGEQQVHSIRSQSGSCLLKSIVEVGI